MKSNTFSSISTGNQAVDLIGAVNLQGNIIPHTWYSHIRTESGMVDITGVIILSEIVYWYRPRIIRDEETGAIIGYQKRFKSDLLQRSYDSFAKQFGFTKRQVSDAIKRLENNGLVKRVFRNITVNGISMSNVLFIDVNPIRIAEITNSLPTDVGGITEKRDTPYEKTGEGVRKNVTPPTEIRETYTEITTETTTETTTDTLERLFDETWSLYPKRSGGNPKAAAKKAWNARIKDGHSPETIKSGVERYALFCKVTNKLNTQYVMQAATFFGPSLRFLDDYTPPKNTKTPVKDFTQSNDAVIDGDFMGLRTDL